MIDTVKKIKKIGKGMHGSIYLVKDKNNKKYALKIEPIFKKDIKYSLSSNVWREIDFASTMYKKYPDHFMKLYDYKIDNVCNHEQDTKEFNFDEMSESQKNFYEKLYASKYCSVKLWTLVDMTLDELLQSWKKFNKSMFCDLLKQIVYVIYLINKEGYFHHDLHTKNIGLVKTNKKYINAFGAKIATNGYFIVILDYGLVLHNKYNLKPWEKKCIEYDNDLFSIVNTLIFPTVMSNVMLKYENIYDKVNIDDIDKEFLKDLLVNIDFDGSKWVNSNVNFFSQILYKIIFIDKYQKEIFGNKYKQTMPLFDCIPLGVVLYIIYNINDIQKVLVYLLNNI